MGHQSRLGPSWLVVSTCKPLHLGVAGENFEFAAAIVKKAEEATGEDPVCRVPGTSHGERVFKARWMSNHEPVMLAALKSTYLIAFACSGYSWGQLIDARSPVGAIANARPGGPADAVETCGLVTDARAGRRWCLHPFGWSSWSSRGRVGHRSAASGTHDVHRGMQPWGAERDLPWISLTAHGARGAPSGATGSRSRRARGTPA
jgi:hypothetical protein